MGAEAFFFIFAAGAIAGSVGVILAKNPVNSAISLVVSFFFLAALYILLHAEFLAIIQVMVYAGAIMVLFLFVIMLLNLKEDDLGEARIYPVKFAAAIGGGAFLLGILLRAILAAPQAGMTVEAATVPEQFGKVAPIGRVLLTEYVLPFELAAILLLVGIVGAVVVAKRRV